MQYSIGSQQVIVSKHLLKTLRTAYCRLPTGLTAYCLFLTSICLLQTGYAQETKPRIGVIRVEKSQAEPEPTVESEPIVTPPPLPSNPQKDKDFTRIQEILYVPFSHSPNYLLRNLELAGTSSRKRKKHPQSLIDIILEEMKAGRLVGLAPDDFKRAYTYENLDQELYKLGGEDAMRYLNTAFKLVIQKGINRQSSTPYRRIQYVCILWEDPERDMEPLTLVVFPYDYLIPLLKKCLIPTWSRSEKMISVHTFLETHMYHGEKIAEWRK